MTACRPTTQRPECATCVRKTLPEGHVGAARMWVQYLLIDPPAILGDKPCPFKVAA